MKDGRVENLVYSASEIFFEYGFFMGQAVTKFNDAKSKEDKEKYIDKILHLLTAPTSIAAKVQDSRLFKIVPVLEYIKETKEKNNPKL